MENLFFELINIAIGKRNHLSCAPSSDEWHRLYKMAVKQSVVGICFAGIEKLAASQLPMKKLVYTWLCQAERIKMRNEILNEQCVKLQQVLHQAGFRSCILKGQGVASYYGELGNLRQCGDIDIWVDGSKVEINNFIRKTSGNQQLNETMVHINFPFFKGTEVEVHYTPSLLRNPLTDMRFQKWIECEKRKQMNNFVFISNGLKITAPTDDFNIIFLLSHIYKHLMGEGFGFRQLMDLYFLLEKSTLEDTQKQKINNLLKSFKMSNFAAGVMWIIQKVFCLDSSKMICLPDEKHGKYIYQEIILCGNFGRYDQRLSTYDYKERSILQIMRNIQQIIYYPDEVLGSFWWRMKSLFNSM